MKKKPEFKEGPQAKENFERTMATLFRVPKSAVAEKIKKPVRKGKD